MLAQEFPQRVAAGPLDTRRSIGARDRLQRLDVSGWKLGRSIDSVTSFSLPANWNDGFVSAAQPQVPITGLAWSNGALRALPGPAAPSCHQAYTFVAEDDLFPTGARVAC